MKIPAVALPLALVSTGFGAVCLLSGSATVRTLEGPAAWPAAWMDPKLNAPIRSLPAPALPRLGVERRNALGVKPAGVGDATDFPHGSSTPAEPSNQAQRPIELALPVDPLLDASASAEQLVAWYSHSLISELVRSHLRLRGLKLFLKAHRGENLDQLALGPEARRMLADPAALTAEIGWLARHLGELREAPFVGALPVGLGDYAADFERQFHSLSLEEFEITRSEIEHAFRSEKARLVEVCFQSGLYSSVFRTQMRFG
jgi:hypothetical protein